MCYVSTFSYKFLLPSGLYRVTDQGVPVVAGDVKLVSVDITETTPELWGQGDNDNACETAVRTMARQPNIKGCLLV
jgi:hypothetical protein